MRETMDNQVISRLNMWASYMPNDSPMARDVLALLQQLESVQRARDGYYENAKYTEAAFHEVTKLRADVESLQRDKAALIEVLKPLVNQPIPNDYKSDQEFVAFIENTREILSKIKEADHE